MDDKESRLSSIQNVLVNEDPQSSNLLDIRVPST